MSLKKFLSKPNTEAKETTWTWCDTF